MNSAELRARVEGFEPDSVGDEVRLERLYRVLDVLDELDQDLQTRGALPDGKVNPAVAALARLTNVANLLIRELFPPPDTQAQRTARHAAEMRWRRSR